MKKYAIAIVIAIALIIGAIFAGNYYFSWYNEMYTGYPETAVYMIQLDGENAKLVSHRDLCFDLKNPKTFNCKADELLPEEIEAGKLTLHINDRGNDYVYEEAVPTLTNICRYVSVIGTLAGIIIIFFVICAFPEIIGYFIDKRKKAYQHNC